MLSRYTPEDFAALWSPLKRYQAWFDVELAACKAMEDASLVPKGTAQSLEMLRDRLDPERIEAIERTTRHDVIAFLTHVEELGGKPARWLHRGMTSSDVLDTSLALLLTQAVDRLLLRSQALLDALKVRIEEHRHMPMIGRSHGIWAEPVTVGMVLAGHFAELARGHGDLQAARQHIAVGTLSGAVGTYSHLTPEIEQAALGMLGLRPETVATQVIPRDRHARLLFSLALIAAGIERLATNIRHWQRSEVGEAEEAFHKGQKGSSAMPHKRNPVLSENLCGLARLLRAAVIPSLENISLWHERDISHSSVERMLFPDTTSTLAFMLDRCRDVVVGLVVYEERAAQNLESTQGLWASEGLMLALVEKGLGRQEGYGMVQRNAMQAFENRTSFRQHILNDSDIRAHLSEQDIDAEFDVNELLRHVDTVIDRALGDAP
ncbi:MAG: adenylosuccinate lyase [Myxococcales bacterium]|nr:adenylosuccinate lyase [Myxococcales bacterium]MCB9708991.1 adenylosuccinate lyase [Myxococcales bacterium]